MFVPYLPYDVGPARVFLGEAEKTTMCGLGPASRVNSIYVQFERASDPRGWVGERARIASETQMTQTSKAIQC